MSQDKKTNQEKLEVVEVKTNTLKPALYNPRKWSEEATKQLAESIQRFGMVDPILANNAKGRENIVIGGHFRLNKNLGDWNYEMLAEFDASILSDIGFSSEDLDTIFDIPTDDPESFDLKKELEKLDIKKITVQKGDIYQLSDSRLMCGDSAISEDFVKLMNGEKANMCMTDPPYILDYLHAKRGGKPVTGFGAKKNRRYLETETLPDNFTELWMKNVADHASPDFSIICYENWKNLRVIWGEMEKYWKVKNMIVWHLPNRHQGFSSKYKFFSKHDIAVVGASGEVEYNTNLEAEPLQELYETALYAISGKPQWEGYEKGKKYMPTDFIEFNADDVKSSGQGIIFGTKPLEILIPYIKVLTERGDLVVEPFCGSGSTLIASEKLNRKCFIMEKSPVYAEVALKRWETLTGKKRVKL